MLKFDLPNIGTGSQITKAIVNIMNYPNSSTNNPLLSVHRITSDWTEESANWSTMNSSYDSKTEIIETYVVNSTNDDLNQSIFRITDLVKKWYSGTPNYGLMIKALNEINDNSGTIPAFYSKQSVNRKPVLIIEYRNLNGTESYIDFSTQSLSYGSMNVNNYNGNLTAIFPMVSTVGGIGTTSLNLIYNTNDVVLNKDVGCGLGFRFNYNQIIKEVQLSGILYTEYSDADGTLHYFNNVTGEYVAEDGDIMHFRFNV